jgi:hypothetical protein
MIEKTVPDEPQEQKEPSKKISGFKFEPTNKEETSDSAPAAYYSTSLQLFRAIR